MLPIEKLHNYYTAISFVRRVKSGSLQWAGNVACMGESRNVLGLTQPPIQWVQGVFPWGQSGRGVKLTTLIHLVQKSRMRGAYTSTLSKRLRGVVLS